MQNLSNNESISHIKIKSPIKPKEENVNMKIELTNLKNANEQSKIYTSEKSNNPVIAVLKERFD